VSSFPAGAVHARYLLAIHSRVLRLQPCGWNLNESLVLYQGQQASLRCAVMSDPCIKRETRIVVWRRVLKHYMLQRWCRNLRGQLQHN
jgi:hypothetical protein